MAEIADPVNAQPEAGRGLSPADLEAIRACLTARLERLEYGLGAAVCGYVLQGDSDRILARFPSLRGVPHFHNSLSSLLGYDAKPDVRRVFLEAQSWEPAVVRRLGELLAAAGRCGGYARRWPGTPQSPDYLRALTHVSVMLLQERAVHSASWLLTGPRCLELLSLDGGDQAQLVDVVFTALDRDYYRQGRRRLLGMSALAQVLAASPARALHGARGLDKHGRWGFLRYLGQTGLSAIPELNEHLLDTLAHAGGRESEAALEALAGCERALQMDGAARLLASDVPARRLAGVRLLRRTGTRAAYELLASHMEVEKLTTLQEEMRQGLWELNVLIDDEQRAGADGAQGYVAIDGRWISIPPVPPLPPEGELPHGLAQGLREAIDKANEAAAWTPSAIAGGGEFYSAAAVEAFLEVLKGGAARAVVTEAVRRLTGRAVSKLDPVEAIDLYRIRLRKLLSQPGVTAQHLARAFALDHGDRLTPLDKPGRCGWASALVERGCVSIPAQLLLEHAQRLGDLRSVLRATAPLGSSENVIGELLCTRRQDWARLFREPAGGLLWPLVAEHLAMLDHPLGVKGAWLRRERLNALLLLSLLPATPRRYLAVLTDLALRGRPEYRPLARQLLAGAPDLLEPLAALLKGGGREERITVAQWLGERGERGAIPHLRAALQRERIFSVRAHLLAALAVLGDHLSDLFNEERLLEEARGGIARMRGQVERCVPVNALPALSWAEGRPVPREVARWLIVLAYKLQQPRGNAFLDLMIERLDKASAEGLGQLVLSSFVNYDTRHPSEEAANAWAARRVERELKALRGVPLWTEESLLEEREPFFARFKAEHLKSFVHDDGPRYRGVLALALRVQPSVLVSVAERYLHDHPQRTAQCYALLDTLAHQGSALALQLLLSIAGHYSRRYQREHADALLEGIARQRGWSREELIDRTIPTGGLGEGGTLTVESDRGAYTVRLDAQLQLVVHNPQGRLVRSLPPGSPGRKAFIELKKTLNETIAHVTVRLYEAMCVERRWCPEELDGLLRHPIAGRLCERLIFAGLGHQGELLGTFRPLGDGTFSDAADGGVDPSQFATIRVAHRALLDGQQIAAWQQHLADYRILPLFEQLGRPLLRVDKALGYERAINDRKGYMIHPESLGTVAAKHGYQRARAGLNQRFQRYEKPFPALRLTAIIDFAQGVPSALMGLRIAGQEREEDKKGLPLSSVPAVLLSETWNDMRDIAAAGSGFDPEWREKYF